MFSIFPESLAGSLLITVAIGVFVAAFYNLRLGWTLSGFIVPGYLTPLFIIKPYSAFIDIFQGIVAYLCVYTLSWIGPRLNLWGSFFGRDCFLALLTMSVLTRIILSFFIIPAISEYATIHYNALTFVDTTFNSFGMVVVTLIANQFWTTGLKRGVVPFSIILLTTYLLVRYGLMEWTNFRISEVGYIYELFYNFYSTQKSYIILLTTAFIASHMNLTYGWTNGGILIASLLALECYFPSRFFITLLDAFIIYSVAKVLLRSPLLETANITRSREISFFFSIGLFYKLLLAWGVLVFSLSIRILDFLGFGYLLSSFIAIKMYSSQRPIRILSIVTQLSWLGAFFGTIFALLLSFSSKILPSKISVRPFSIPLLGEGMSLFSLNIRLFIFLVVSLAFFGLGYLLSKLISKKTYGRRKSIRILDMFTRLSWPNALIGIFLALVISFFSDPAFLSEILPLKVLVRPSSISPHFKEDKVTPEKVEKRVGYLSDFLFERKSLFAEKGTNLYRVPSVNDLYYFDEKVLSPLVHLLNQDINPSDLESLNGTAKTFGYKIILLEEENTSYLVLAENEKNVPRHYGATFIFRLHNSSPFIFQVPNGLSETNTLEGGLYLFSKLKGKAFIFSEAHPDANLDGSASLESPLSKESFFDLGAQILLRNEGDSPFMLVLIRGYSYSSPFVPLKGTTSNADIFLTFDNGAVRESQLSPLQKTLVDALHKEHFQTLLSQDTGETAGYGQLQFQGLLYLNQTRNKEYTLLWFSPSERFLFRRSEHTLLRLSQMNALDIPVNKISLKEFVQTKGKAREQNLPREVEDLLKNYLESDDVLFLQKLIETIRPYTFTYIIDPLSQENFLVILNSEQHVIKALPVDPKELQEQKK